jgi:PPOX class probable F420-dependent enzyme
VSYRPSTTDRPGQEAADSGRFVPLPSAKYLLLTTFNQDGAPLAAPVRVVADCDRAFFRISSASGTSKRLRHTDWVQVAACTVLGLCRTGPTVNATARLLAGAEASQAAEQLAHRYPAWRGLIGSMARRVTGWQALYYELRADEAAEEPAAAPAEGRAKAYRRPS